MRLSNEREAGVSMVEAAIVFGLALILVMGVIDFARVAAANSAVNSASREAARYGSATGLSGGGIPRYTDCAEIRATAARLDLVIEIDPADIAVSYDHGPGTAVFLTCPVGGPNPAPAAIASGDRIIVEVTIPFNFVSPEISVMLGPYVVESIDRRTIAKP